MIVVPIAILFFTGSWLWAGVAFVVGMIATGGCSSHQCEQVSVQRCPKCSSPGRLNAVYCHECGARMAQPEQAC